MIKKIERPGPVNVGEFSPLNTPLNPGNVTTAQDTAQNHSKTPADPGPTGSMTKTHDAPIRITRK